MGTRARVHSWSGDSTPIVWPLTVASNGRYLQQADGTPRFLQTLAIWSCEVQLSNAEIDTLLNAVVAHGYNTVLFETIEHEFSSQTPAYLNKDGLAPFSTMTDFGSSFVAGYWNRVDYIVNQCLAKNIACIICPAYLGYNGGSQGWTTEVNAASDAALQTYGANLANRYPQGNIIWCAGGDYNGGDSAGRNKQWNIFIGIRSVRTSNIITVHSSPDTDPHTDWGGFAPITLNTTYGYSSFGFDAYAIAATAYADPKPFFFIEGEFEHSPYDSASYAELRKQAYQTLCGGGCGNTFGNYPIWEFDAPQSLETYTGTWTSNLDSTGMQQQALFIQFVSAIAWWKLVPKTDTSLVSSSLGSGATRICPALASDGTLAIVWIPGATTVTVVMSALSPSSVRARLFDPTTGSYSTVSGSPFSNSGTRNFTSTGECVLVLDAG